MKNIYFDSTEKILIISPHPDDEIIGCGGVILSYASQCDVLLLTDGCKGHGRWSEDRTRRIRSKEFKDVMERCMINNFACLGIKDRTLAKHLDCYGQFNLDKYDVIFVPNKNERHPDHKAAFRQLMIDNIVHRRIRRIKKIYQYEVWSPLINPTHILDVSAIYERKLETLCLYESQIKELDYASAVRGLNMYRGITNHMLYAECYRQGY